MLNMFTDTAHAIKQQDWLKFRATDNAGWQTQYVQPIINVTYVKCRYNGR